MVCFQYSGPLVIRPSIIQTFNCRDQNGHALYIHTLLVGHLNWHALSNIFAMYPVSHCLDRYIDYAINYTLHNFIGIARLHEEGDP